MSWVKAWDASHHRSTVPTGRNGTLAGGTLPPPTYDRGITRIGSVTRSGLREQNVPPPSQAAGPRPSPTGRFADIPAGHPDEEDIYLSVRCGIVKGISDHAYGPLQSLKREEMALLLVRLAALVGIQVPPAGKTRFSDIHQLPRESQEAIDQLTTQLELSYGTSATTFSPAQAVTRGQVALFLQRLMNKIPVLQERGRTPDDVIKKIRVSDAGSSFTDLGSVTVATYDAIVQLHLLGVVSGVSSNVYAPSALITRAAMARFVARVMELVERETEVGTSVGSRGSDARDAGLVSSNRGRGAYLYDQYDPDPLDEEAERMAEEGSRGPHDTVFYVPHQQEDRLIEFDLLTSTVDDIISRCGYSEHERSELAEVHRRLAEHGLQFYRGPRPERIPLLEGTP